MFGYKLGYRIKRLRVKWRNWKTRFDTRISPETQITSPFQEKAIRLWRLVLKDEESKLGINPYGVRQIEKENLLMIFQYTDSNSDSILTIMDITETGNNIYELHINAKQAYNVCDYFDDEMDRRMSKSAKTKRIIIETDLDKLVNFHDLKLKKIKGDK